MDDEQAAGAELGQVVAGQLGREALLDAVGAGDDPVGVEHQALGEFGEETRAVPAGVAVAGHVLWRDDQHAVHAQHDAWRDGAAEAGSQRPRERLGGAAELVHDQVGSLATERRDRAL